MGMEGKPGQGNLIPSGGGWEKEAVVMSSHLLPSQGVVEFSLCLLFAKLVSYTFLYWLPLYIVNVGEFWGW